MLLKIYSVILHKSKKGTEMAGKVVHYIGLLTL